jgi:hypothetical protein
MTADRRALVDAMLLRGGGFEQALACCLNEVGNDCGFGLAVMELYGAADEANAKVVAEAFFHDWFPIIVRSGPSEREALLRATFKREFERFERMVSP